MIADLSRGESEKRNSRWSNRGPGAEDATGAAAGRRRPLPLSPEGRRAMLAGRSSRFRTPKKVATA
jgi:hypothetical protein